MHFSSQSAQQTALFLQVGRRVVKLLSFRVGRRRAELHVQFARARAGPAKGNLQGQG